MSKRNSLPPEVAPQVRDTCLCLHLQQAARALARRFDDAFRPLELTSGQFSLLMSLHRPEPPGISEVAAVLAMDRTTLTAALKPLQRRALVEVQTDPQDRRARRLVLTPAGAALLAKAYPVWRATHETLDPLLPDSDADRFRAALRTLADRGGAARISAG